MYVHHKTKQKVETILKKRWVKLRRTVINESHCKALRQRLKLSCCSLGGEYQCAQAHTVGSKVNSLICANFKLNTFDGDDVAGDHLVLVVQHTARG